MFRFTTAGESHGRALVCIIEGVPAGLPIDEEFINHHLSRRQKGYGRGGRMKIETDRAEILSGVRGGTALGSPVSLVIWNKDWENWKDRMSPRPSAEFEQQPKLTRPRPGHADLSGALKYGFDDIRNVLERSSARETAARVAAGAVAMKLLSEFGVRLLSYVRSIGEVSSPGFVVDEANFASVLEMTEESPVRCPDPGASREMMKLIRLAKERGDSLGGVFEVVALGLPVGLGSYVSWSERLDGLLAGAIMSIQGIKGVEIGLGFEAARRYGSKVHDEIFRGEPGAKMDPCGGYRRHSNNAGGLEGGMTNGEPIVVRAAMKPIPTLYKPLRSVDIATGEPFEASVERSDACAVPAAAVVGEAMAAVVLADAFTRKFGGDSLGDMRANYEQYLRRLGNNWRD